jgi:hypothetical protein
MGKQNMKALTAAQERNRAVAESINAEALANPASPYAGKFIGVVGGAVAIVADSVDELGTALDRMGQAASDCFCIEAGRDYEEPEYIWSVG